MLSTLPTSPAPSRPARLEICPPSLLREQRPWWRQARDWLSRGWIDAADDRRSALARAKHDFTAALADLGGAKAEELLDRVHFARTLRDLWHLRAEIFSQVSLQHSQHDADARLARLNRHFPTRAPRSGFGTLEPRDMWP